MTDAQIRSEDCRLAVLAALHARKGGAFTADTIKSVFLSRMDFTVAEVEDALTVLAALEYVKLLPHPVGATKAAQITGKGILFKERGHD